ncbi:MAG TPA: hypothetical protein VFU28_10505 [Vicinamibacterales bacterium]|nr:hypothetical protein [Vicinamibacterales bacterium]
MSRAIRYVELFIVTFVAAIALSQLSALGQEARSGRGAEGRSGSQAQKLPEAPAIGFFGSYRVATEKTDPSKLPIIGAWRINFDRSDPALKLANRFKDTGTVIYTADNGGIKQEVFLYWPPPKVDYKNVFTDDAREFWFKLDGKNIYPNPQGPNGLGQTVAMWLVDRNTLYRERATKGVVDERVIYRVAPDGNTLVWTNFNADANSGHQVWNRIPIPAR